MAFVAGASLGESSRALFRPQQQAKTLGSTCKSRGEIPQASRRMHAPRMGADIRPGFGIKNQADDISWSESYKSYLRRSGEMVCRMAMEGHKKLGRGAVFVNDESQKSQPVGFVVREGDGMRKSEGLPGFYASLGTLLEQNRDDPEMGPILSRIRLYDPAKQFVIVYETGGMQGVDIVTPKHMPTTPSDEIVDIDEANVRFVED